MHEFTYVTYVCALNLCEIMPTAVWQYDVYTTSVPTVKKGAVLKLTPAHPLPHTLTPTKSPLKEANQAGHVTTASGHVTSPDSPGTPIVNATAFKTPTKQCRLYLIVKPAFATVW